MKQNNTISDYLKWFNSNGGYFDGVEINEKNGVRGLFATKYIPANTAIIAIPNKLTINIKSIAKSELKDLFKAHKS